MIMSKAIYVTTAATNITLSFHQTSLPVLDVTAE